MAAKQFFTIKLISCCLMVCGATPAVEDSEYEKVPKSDPTLIYALGIYRHGARSPLFFNYKSNPHTTSTHFPEGRGKLTKAGERLMFNVGRALRARYNDFMGDNGTFDPKTTRFTSDKANRNIQSATLITEGMFGTMDMADSNKTINEKHHIPITFDTKYFDKSHLVLSFSKDTTECKYFSMQFAYCIIQGLRLSPTEDQREVISYLEKQTGIKFESIVSYMNIWDRLECERVNGLPLPEWTTSVYPERMAPFIRHHIREVIAGTPLMNDLATAPLFKEIHRLFNDASRNQTSEKVYFHATHDYSLYEVFFKLKIQEPVIVEVGDVMLIELHKIDDNFYVKTYYYQPYHNILRPMVIPGCDESCPLEQFRALTPEMSQEKWKSLCQTRAKSFVSLKQSVTNVLTLLKELVKWANLDEYKLNLVYRKKKLNI